MSEAPEGSRAAVSVLDTADWRRRVFALYAEVRASSSGPNGDPAAAWAVWREGRDRLMAEHPATALLPEDRDGFAGLPFEPYDPAWRFELPIEAADALHLELETGTDGVVPFDRLGVVEVPGAGSLDVWKLGSYGGGIFVPVKDALSRVPGGTYGGGRYLIDTIKGADLGTDPATATIVLDFNFAYNPSCAYDPTWACPLAQRGNTLPVEVPVGERYPAA